MAQVNKSEAFLNNAELWRRVLSLNLLTISCGPTPSHLSTAVSYSTTIFSSHFSVANSGWGNSWRTEDGAWLELGLESTGTSEWYKAISFPMELMSVIWKSVVIPGGLHTPRSNNNPLIYHSFISTAIPC